MVANGSLEGGAMLFEHLLGPGDRVVVEQPTYDRTLLLLQRLGVELVPVPLEADGLDLGALEAALAAGPIKLAHVIPNAHNPAGCTLSAAKRARLVELAAEHGFWIFEDDPYRELPFEGEPLETMLSLDEAGRVIHASSFSKTVSPGVRVGYLAGPAEEIAKLAKRANETYISPNMLAESIVLELCRSGELDRNIAFVKGELKARCDALVAALREQIPEAEFVVPEGGYFLWLDLAAGTDTTALLAGLQSRGRHLRRRPRLHDRGRREQPPPLLRAGPGGPGGRGRLPHRRRPRAHSRRRARLSPTYRAARRTRASQVRSVCRIRARIDDPMPERLDQRHVSLPEPTARLDVDGHLSLVAVFALVDPGQVHHAVHGLVRHLGGELDVGAVERHEGQGAEIQIRRRVAQVLWQAVGQ